MSDVTNITSKAQFARELNSTDRVVVNFGAPDWCVPCQRFEPHWERAASEVDGTNFLFVDVDKNDWAMVEYAVRSVPTVKLFENGAFVRDIKAPQGALPFIKDLG